MLTANLLQHVEEITMGSPLTLYVPLSIEVLLNSHHTHYLSVSILTSYEVLLLTSSNVTIAVCNTLNPATILPVPSLEPPMTTWH